MALSRSARHLSALAVCCLLLACPGTGDEPPEPPTPPPDPSELPCDPPLVLTPDQAALNPLSITGLQASGGTEDYIFEQVENGSGGILNPLTGGYLSGALEGTVDVFRLTDRGCIGEATAEIQILAGMEVLPEYVVLPYDDSFEYEIVGGSGSYECVLPLLESYGTVTSGCVFTAPSFDAYDQVRVIDVETGEEVDVTVRTIEEAVLETEAQRIFVPTGSEYLFQLSGGSDLYDVELVDGDSVSWTGEAFVPSEPGTSTYRFSDRFVDLSVEIEVTGVQPQSPPLERWGDFSTSGSFLTPGDLDGDARPDLLLGLGEIDLNATNGGAVFLYSGSTTGVDASPSSSWGGWEPGEAFGDSLAVGDFDADGLADLAVGSPLADLGGASSGAVSVFGGLEGGGFSSEPILQIEGPSAGALFGDSLAACDFNADGITDLAVGAPRGEDSLAFEVSNNQGAVYVHLGGVDGLQVSSENAAWGEMEEEEGGFSGRSNAFIGRTLAAGDMDGDGFCDLAIGAWEFTTGGGQGQDGAVHLYRGKAADAFDGGGLEWDPIKVWIGDPEEASGTEFGYALAMDDLDGDGLADLVVGQPRHLDPEGLTGRPGAVLAFLGRDFIFDELRTEVAEDSADWVVLGDDTNDRFGEALALGDLNGDGVPDLVVGSPVDEDAAGPVDAGGAAVFHGVSGSLPPPVADAWIRSSGEEDPSDPTVLEAGDRFGQLTAILAAGAADEVGEVLVHSGLDNSLGWNVGRTLAIPGEGQTPWRPLDLPGGPSAQGLGSGVALVGDINGDGWDDLAVGAPGQALGEGLYGAGTVHLFAGSPEGFSVTESTELREFPMHSSSDGLGTAIDPAGDFDGDGYDDFVVFAPGEDRPSSFGTAFANPDDCPAARSNSGAAWIFSGGEELPDTPSFVWFGSRANAAIVRSAGPLDWNGDGMDDLIIAEPGYSEGGPANRGSVMIFFGRSSDPLGISVLCSPDEVLEGFRSGDAFGTGVAVLGDLDEDGCDDVAVGAPSEDLAGNGGGSLRVVFGWGPGCRPEPAAITMANTVNTDNFGAVLSAGGDADGDGLPDLLVSASNRSVGIGNELGSVWLVPGWYLASIPPEPWDGSDPQILWPFSPDSSRYRLNGWIDDEQFGVATAFVPGFTQDGRDGIAVGGPAGQLGGLYGSGGVRVHEVDISSGGTWGHFIDPTPTAVLGGENHHAAGAQVGRWLDGGSRDGQPVLVVGGPGAHSLSTSGGTAWVLELASD